MAKDPKHNCHAPDCPVKVPPSMFACSHHWRILPRHLKDEIWTNYIPGQEDRRDPSPAYLQAARDAVSWYLENDNQGANK